MLKLTEINDLSEFLQLNYTWNSVLASSRENNPFLSWEYQSTYWKHFGKDKRLRVLCITTGNKIVAIAPLEQSRYSFAHFGYDVISPLGYSCSDYTGLVLGEKENDSLKLIMGYLIEQNDWDFMYLFNFPGTSVNYELLHIICNIVPKSELKEGTKCPFLSLPSSIDVFMQGLGKSLRYNLRRYMNKLERDYQRVEFKKYDEVGTVEESVKIFFELHQKRWKSKGGAGVFGTKQVRDFWLDISMSFADKGWLALYFLTVADTPIAAVYCYEYNQKMYFVLSGLDPDYSKYSIGNIIHQKMMEKCILNGINEYDFLKGDEPYKFDWTRTYRRNLNARIVNNKLASNLFDFALRTVKQTKTDKIFGKLLSF